MPVIQAGPHTLRYREGREALTEVHPRELVRYPEYSQVGDHERPWAGRDEGSAPVGGGTTLWHETDTRDDDTIRMATIIVGEELT